MGLVKQTREEGRIPAGVGGRKGGQRFEIYGLYEQGLVVVTEVGSRLDFVTV